MITRTIITRTIATLTTVGALMAAVVAGMTTAHAQPPCHIDPHFPLLGNCPFGPPTSDPACHMDYSGAHYVCDDHPRTCGPYGCSGS
jgi:hypothetical protein